jgi:hypothetical protein
MIAGGSKGGLLHAADPARLRGVAAAAAPHSWENRTEASKAIHIVF